MTDPLTGSWQKVNSASLAFNFVNLPETLAGIVRTVQSPSIVGVVQVDGVSSLLVRGTILSQDLIGLVPAAARGLPVGIQVWIGREDHLVRQAQLEGPVRSDEPQELVRVLRFHSFDQPVDIALPQ